MIVTGAGSGLGRAHALRLAREGAIVGVNDLAAVAAEGVAAEICAFGGEAAPLGGDVADWGTAERLIGEMVCRYGRLDVLVNNAGNLRERSLASMSEAEWDDVIRVHLKGHFAMLRWASQHWRSRSKAGETVRASVVNTTSNSGLFGQPTHASYGAAKAGIAALTTIAAVELERYGVRVNAISPAARTAMTDSVPAVREFMEKKDAPLDPWDPDHASALVAWLARESCDATGQCWLVFGGCLQRLTPWGLGERIDAREPWTPESIGEAMERLPRTSWREPFTVLG